MDETNVPNGRRPTARMTGAGRRRWLLPILLVGSIVMTAGAFYAGQQVKSPDQQAAEAAAPAETTLTVPVEQRVVGETVSLNATVEAGQGVDVKAAGSEGVGRLVVSGVNAAVGGDVAAGEVPVEVSGRPVFALEGAIPAYRDLGPGNVGEDVSQLQDALSDLGYDIWDTDGHYGSATKAAVERLYESSGFRPVGASADEAAEISEAEQVVEDAKDELADAESETATSEEDAPDIAEMEAAVQDAQDVLAELQEQAGASLPMSEVVFAPALPARAVSVPVQEAAEVAEGDRLLTLAGGPLVARAEIQPVQAEPLAEGMTATLSFGEEQIEGEILLIRELEAEEEGQTAGVEVVVSGDLPDEWAGQSVRVDVAVSSTEAEVLAVPVSGLYESADGTASVIKIVDGTEATVEVETGLAGGGYVEIVSGDLAEGDEVVVGAR